MTTGLITHSKLSNLVVEILVVVVVVGGETGITGMMRGGRGGDMMTVEGGVVIVIGDGVGVGAVMNVTTGDKIMRGDE